MSEPVVTIPVFMIPCDERISTGEELPHVIVHLSISPVAVNKSDGTSIPALGLYVSESPDRADKLLYVINVDYAYAFGRLMSSEASKAKKGVKS